MCTVWKVFDYIIQINLSLKCLEVHCSRYVNEHMLFHGIDKGDDHRLSLSFSDLSVWCYACDAYVDNPVRRAVQGDSSALGTGLG